MRFDLFEFNGINSIISMAYLLFADEVGVGGSALHLELLVHLIYVYMHNKYHMMRKLS
jgi:hypothetical protein